MLAIIRKIKGKNARSMMAKMYTIIRDEKLPIRSITVDNGLEFQMMGITENNSTLKFTIVNFILHSKEILMKT